VAEVFSRFGLSDRRLHTVLGSSERQYSVAAALAHPALATAEVILVHDAVRPLTTIELWEKMAQGAQEHPAVVPVVPIADTVKQVDAFGQVCGTVDRSTLFRVQTPQAFEAAVLRSAYSSVSESPMVATDCATLVERSGYPVFTIPGDETNFKVTTSYDREVAEFILQRTASPL
jgi:2-C-methyl-D-erythritol 4-phosphate cytidylyltransferase